MILAVGTLVSVSGCLGRHSEEPMISLARLTQGRLVVPSVLGRARITADESLPDRLVQRLSDEFALVSIRSPRDWREIRDRFGFEPLTSDTELAHGMVVGLIANIGESAQNRWPIRVGGARLVDGAGWMDFEFHGGIYHPVRTAGYLVLAYVPGLRSIQAVRVGQRSFVIRSGADLAG